MTTHPLNGLTTAQRQAFHRIRAGQPPGARPKTIRALLDRGLIEESDAPKWLPMPIGGIGMFMPIWGVPSYKVAEIASDGGARRAGG